MKLSKLLFVTLFVGIFSQAQVGVNATAVDPSAALDIQFGTTPKGLLTPRMTTAQKLAIVNPADGLMIYDTDIKSFFYYKAALAGPPVIPATWNRLSSEANGRLNFKRIKSTDVLATVLADEKAAGGGTKYLLNSNTYYEVNGTINLDLPIGINNAYIVGLDANEDKLVKTSGNLFDGTKGGTIKNLTITASGGNAFSLIGTAAENLLIRDCIITGCSNVGTISGYGLVFCSVIQYAANTTGIVYENINQLLLNNIGWFKNNTGTFEKYIGTFNLIQKLGGFMDLTNGTYGVDVSANPTISGDAVLESVVFTGDATGTKYVKKYTTGSYLNFNFNNRWAVTCGGIPVEGDRFTTGNLYLNRTVTYPTISFDTPGTSYKLPGTTISTNLYRMSDGLTIPLNNRIYYIGQKSRIFTATSSISMQVGGTGTTDFLFFFVKYTAAGVGTVVTSSETFIDSNSGFVQSFPVTGTVQLSAGEYVELHGTRLSGTNKALTFNSYNMSLR